MTSIPHGSSTHGHTKGVAPLPQTTGAPPQHPAANPAWDSALQSASTSAKSSQGPSGSSPAFRPDLAHHLSGPDGFKSGKLHGTHNQQNAISELNGRNGKYNITPTSTPGVNQLDYEVMNPNTNKIVKGSKTTYDPAIHSDQGMLDKSKKAGIEAFGLHQANPNQKVFDSNQDGINFRSYINNDKSGNPFIGNVHPIQ